MTNKIKRNSELRRRTDVYGIVDCISFCSWEKYLHKEYRKRAKETGRSNSGYLKYLIREDLKQEKGVKEIYSSSNEMF